jgi:serine O-acetyltransferase
MTQMSTWSLICADFARAWDREVPSSRLKQLALVLSCAGTVRGFATIGFRLSHAAGDYSSLTGSILKQLNQVITGCDIGHQAQIGPGLRMLHPAGVVINPHAVIGARFTIHSNVTIGGSPTAAPLIGDDVNLAPGARVLGAVKIGNRVRVGANAVLTKTIEGEDMVLAGVPARILREINSKDLAGVRDPDRPSAPPR